jgi:two-component system, NtrC family, nitrogen regulation sensor histidine kinase NtrY
MLKKLFHKIQGDRKYFAIVFFIFVLILISAFRTPRVIENVKNNWNEELAKKIENIELFVHKQFDGKMISLLHTTNLIKSDLRNIFTTGDEAYREIIRVLNRKIYEDYSIGIFAPNGRMIAWNNPVIITQENLFPLNSPLGEIYFLETDLITYLSQTDTVLIDNDNFYLTISRPIEKKIHLHNKYFKPVSFIQELSEENRIDFEIIYNPYSPKTKDGKKVSFDLLSNAGNKIGLVTFYKPVLMLELNDIKEASSTIQASLVFMLIIFTALGMKSDYLHIKSRLLKTLFLLLFLSIARTVLFVLDFPSSLISGSLSDPSNFSSVFAWGIVKSPVEFLTTNIFLLIIAVQIYRYSRNYFFSESPVRYLKLIRFLSLPLLIIFLLLIRG